MRILPTRRLLRRRERKAGRDGKLTAGLVLLIMAVLLIAVGRIFPSQVADARKRLSGPISSMLTVLQAPLQPLSELGQRFTDFINMERELRELRQENEELKGWKWRAVELERQLADLSALNRVLIETGYEYATTRVVARSIGAHSRSVLIGAGGDAGVPPNAAVLNQRGLVGTTFEVGPQTSRVRFVTDAKARLLVSIGRGLVTAEALGTGGGYLAILDGGRTFDIAVGDEVITAGEEGGVPRGLRVGRVVGSSKGMRIAPYADFDRLEFVSVLVPGQNGTSADSSPGGAGGNGAHLTAHLRDGATGSAAASPAANPQAKGAARRHERGRD